MARSAAAAGPSAAAPDPSAGAGKVVKPLERVPEPEEEVAAPTRPYRVARLDIALLRAPLHETPPGTLAEWIARVVEVESPVDFDEVMLRIREAAGVGRAGSRIRARMRLGADAGVGRGLYRTDGGGFIWRPDHETVEIRRRDGDVPVSLRNPARIAPEEIASALVHAVRASFGIGPDDAVQEAVRLFGFKRAGPKIVARFSGVLDGLVADGTLVREGALLQVC